MAASPPKFPKHTQANQFNFGKAKQDGSNAQSPFFFAEEDGYLRAVGDDGVVYHVLTETNERIKISALVP